MDSWWLDNDESNYVEDHNNSNYEYDFYSDSYYDYSGSSSSYQNTYSQSDSDIDLNGMINASSPISNTIDVVRGIDFGNLGEGSIFSWLLNGKRESSLGGTYTSRTFYSWR